MTANVVEVEMHENKRMTLNLMVRRLGVTSVNTEQRQIAVGKGMRTWEESRGSRNRLDFQ